MSSVNILKTVKSDQMNGQMHIILNILSYRYLKLRSLHIKIYKGQPF